MAAEEKVVEGKFTPKDGPFFKTLEKSLKELNVERQAYQGGTFVGNHVHKLLQVRVYIMNHLTSTSIEREYECLAVQHHS